MENIKYVTDSYGVEHIIIEHADGSITGMSKAVYDEQLAQSKEIASNEASPE